MCLTPLQWLLDDVWLLLLVYSRYTLLNLLKIFVTTRFLLFSYTHDTKLSMSQTLPFSFDIANPYGSIRHFSTSFRSRSDNNGTLSLLNIYPSLCPSRRVYDRYKIKNCTDHQCFSKWSIKTDAHKILERYPYNINFLFLIQWGVRKTWLECYIIKEY